MAKHTFTEREQRWIEASQRDFNRHMKEWCEDDRVVPFWTLFTECEMKHFSKIILDVDDLYEEEIEECESPKNIKKATKDLEKLLQKLLEENKGDISKLIDLVVVFRRKQWQHDGLDNGISALVGVYDSLIEQVVDFLTDHFKDYSEEDLKRFETHSGYDMVLDELD